MLLLKLAIRNIFRWKRRSFLTGLSMTFGFVLASFSLSISEGSYGNMIDLFTRDHTGHVQIHADDYLERPSLYKRIKNLDGVLSSVDQVDGVLSASPRIYGPSLAFAGEKTHIANVIGIDPEREYRTTLLGQKLKEGELIDSRPNADGYDVVMIGVNLSENLNLKIGDEVVLIGQGADGSIANEIYVVGGIVGTKDSYERLNLYMDINAARRYLSMGSVAHEIAVVTNAPEDARDLAQRISSTLGDDTLSAAPWQVVEEVFYNTMTADKQSNWVMIGIIIAMVSIGVLNAVLMSALERTREFGVLRSLGTRPKMVFSMIVVETMMLGFLSCILGFAISLPLNMKLAEAGIPIGTSIDVGGIAFDSILGEVSMVTLGAPAIIILFSAFIVSLMPAFKVARIVPTDALKAV